MAESPFAYIPEQQDLAAFNLGRSAGAPTPFAYPAPPPPPKPKQGFFTDVGHGFARGAAVALPEMAGQALQAFGANETGKSLEQSAKLRGEQPGYEVNPGGWGEAASMVVPALATGALAFIPGIGEAAAPAGAAALFGGSQYTQTREKGGSVAQGLGTAAVQGVGQAIAGHVAGKLLTGAGQMFRPATAQSVLDGFANPSVVGRTIANTVKAAGVQVPTQAAAAGGVAAIENNLPDTPSAWEAAKASVGPSLMMTALMAPFGAAGTALSAGSKARIGRSVSQPFDDAPLTDTQKVQATSARMKDAEAVWKQMKAVDPESAAGWWAEARLAIVANKPVALDPNFKYTPLEQPVVPGESSDMYGRQDLLPAPATAMGDAGLQNEDQRNEAAARAQEVARLAAQNDALWTARDAQEKQVPGTGPATNTRIEDDGLGATHVRTTTDDAAPGEPPPPGGGGTPDLPRRVGMGEVADAVGRADRDVAFTKAEADAEAQRQRESDQLWRDSQLPRAEYDAQVAAAMGPDSTGNPAMRLAMERALANAPKVSIDEQGQSAWEGTKQDRVAWLRGELGKNVSKLTNALADLGPQELATEVQRKWLANGGEAATAQYNPRLEAMYKWVTGGKDIREVSSETTKPAETTERAAVAGESPAVAQAGNEVHEGARDASAQKEVATQPPGDTNALVSTQEQGRTQAPEQRQISSESTSENARVPDESQVGQRDATPDPSAQEAGITPKKAAAYTEALVDKRDAASGLDTVRGELGGLFKQKSKLNATIAGAEPTREQYAERQRIDRAIGEAKAREASLLQDHSDAIGRIEQFRSGAEPTSRLDHYDPMQRPYTPLEGASGSNLSGMRSWLEARVIGKTATPEEQKLFGTLGGWKPTSGSVAAARKALDLLTPEQHAQWQGLAERYGRALDLAAEMGKLARAKEGEVARSVGEEHMTEARFNERLDIIERNRALGLITPDAAEKAIVQTMADAANEQAENGRLNRGLSGLNDPKLAPVVGKAIHAADVMQHIAANHSNPLMRIVAGVLNKANPTAIVHVIDNPDFVGGRYDPQTNTIEIGRGGLNSITLMHETVHALTHAAIDRSYWHATKDYASLHPVDRAELEAVKKIRGAMDSFAAVADPNNPTHRLAMQDEHEFLSEAISNPGIQQLLGGRSGALTRFWNGLREAVGLDAKHQTKFEQMMDAATTLFGDPNRDTMQVFRSALERGGDERNPMQAIGTASRVLESLTGASSVLGGRMKRIAGDKILHNQEIHAWLTLTDSEKRLGFLTEKMGNAFPALKPLLQRVNEGYGGFRAVAESRRADSSKLLAEGQEYVLRMFAMQKESPAGMELVNRMANDARATGVHPKYRSLVEAQRDNPAITDDMFDHSAAASARNAYARVAQMSRQMEAQGKTDTPLKVYEDGLAMNKLVLTRKWGQMVNMAAQGFDLPSAKNLDFTEHLRDGRTPRTLADQEQRINSALNRTKAEADALVKTVQDRAVADAVAKRGALSPEQEATVRMGAARAEVGLRDSIESMLGEYNQQRAVPYYHLGRVGDHYISFEVPGSKAEWDRVGAVVGGDWARGGLARDWRDVLPNGNRRVFMKFEGAYQHNEAVSRLATLVNQGLAEKYSAGPTLEYNKATGGATPAFLRAMSARFDGMDSNAGWTDEIKGQAKQALSDLYLSQLPETSPLKANMLADNTAGASRDTTDMFRKRLEMGNRALVNARSSVGFAAASGKLDAAVKELNAVKGTNINDDRNQVGVYVKELQARQADMQTPVDVNRAFAGARAGTAMWRLGLAPMYIAMVGYQPWQITMPALGAKFGYAKAAMTMARSTPLAWAILNSAMKTGWMAAEGSSTFNKLSKISDITIDASKLKNPDGSSVLNERQIDLIDHLMGTGLVNVGITRELYQMAPNDMSPAAKALRVAQLMPHYIEMSNRILTALAAHDLAMQRGDGSDAAHLSAKQYAMGVIRETDGDHSQVNVARRLGQRGVLAQGTPLVVGFGQYDIQMTEFLARSLQRAFSKNASAAERSEMRRMLGGVAVMTGGIAGALGMPFVGAAAGIYNAVAQAWQEEGETPPDAEKMWRDGLRSMIAATGVRGEALDKATEVMARGVPRALGPNGEGFDMSGRSGYQDLLPMTSILTDRQKLSDRFKDGAFNFMGPTVGAMAGMATGARAFYEGDWVKGVNDALPAVARNAAKAYMMSKYGYETSGANNQIPLPVTSWDVAMQSIGALPGKKAEQSEQQFQWTVNQQILQARHQVIMNEILRNADRGDYAGMQRAMQRSLAFATQQPEFRKFDVGQALVGRAQERAIGGMPGMDGVLVSKAQLPYYQRFAGMPAPQ